MQTNRSSVTDQPSAPQRLGGTSSDNLLSITVHDGESSETYQAITDHLGTVHAFVDENGDTVDSCRYDAWDNVLALYDGAGLLIPSSGPGEKGSLIRGSGQDTPPPDRLFI